MHCIQPRPSTLMQNMQQMKSGLARLKISSREFYIIILAPWFFFFPPTLHLKI